MSATPSLRGGVRSSSARRAAGGAARVLLHPWSGGGSAAYTGHCLVLARALEDGGFRVAFADSGSSDLVRRVGFEVLPQHCAKQAVHDPRSYLPFANVERVYAVAARYYRRDLLHAQIEEEARIIHDFGADVVVTDMSATAAIAARAAGLPLVSIAEADFLSTAFNSWMPWLADPSQRLLPYPSCLPTFNAELRERGLAPVDNVADLLWGDEVIVPSIPRLDPIQADLERAARLHYVGPLYWEPPWISDLPLPAARPRRRRVYITLGSGSTMPREEIQTTIDACRGMPWDVFVSAGYAFDKGLDVPDNVTLASLTGLERPLAWAEVVVSHGGSSTVLATLLHGKPLLVIPTMSECEMNGRSYVQAQGAGLLLRASEVTPTGKLVFHNRYSGPTHEPRVTIADVREGLSEILADECFAQAARDLSRDLQRAREQASFVAIFEKLLGAPAIGGR